MSAPFYLDKSRPRAMGDVVIVRLSPDEEQRCILEAMHPTEATVGLRMLDSEGNPVGDLRWVDAEMVFDGRIRRADP